MADYRPVPGTTEHRNVRRRQLGCVVVSLGSMGMLLLIAAYVCVFRSVPLRISKETTYITGPLKSDGERVDYFGAWEQETYPESIAGEENGYRLIVQHLGAAPEATPEHAAQIRRKLGLVGAPPPDMTFQEPDDFLRDYLESDNFDEALIDELTGEDEASDLETVLRDRLYQPWTLDDLPMMEDWLAENGPAIDLIAEATRKPTFHIPFARDSEDDQLIALLLPEIQQTRWFARGLSVRANYRIASGDIDGAIDDIIACKRFGRQVGHGGPLVQTLVGIAIEGIGNAIGIAGSLEHPPTMQQLERLVDGLNHLPPESEFEEALQFERYMTLDFIQALATGKGSLDEWGLPAELPRGIGIDWNVVSRRMNGYFDTLPTAGGFPRPVWKWQAIISSGTRSEIFADMVAALVLPAWDAAQEALWRRTCVDRMQRITLATLRYERDQGTLFPVYTVDADGNPLHSWRVVLLPYLGQQELHDKIRLDEPWDSDHNRQFHDEAIAFYQCPSAGLAPGRTTYSVVVGPDLPFEAGEGKALSEFGANSANMILVVERTEAVCWMDPMEDVLQGAAEEGINVFDGSGHGIGSQHPGGANFGFRDGGVRFLSEVMDIELYKGLLEGTADRIP